MSLHDAIDNISSNDYSDGRRWLYESVEHFEENRNYGMARVLDELFKMLEDYQPKMHVIDDEEYDEMRGFV